MGAVFFFTLLPIILTKLGIIIAVGIIGIALFVVGVGGSIISAAAVNNKKIKRVSLYFFSSLLLLGLSCMLVIGGIFSAVYFFIIPVLIAFGAAVVVLNIIGIVAACNIEKKMVKITLIILLSLSAIIGSVVLAVGIFILIVS